MSTLQGLMNRLRSTETKQEEPAMSAIIKTENTITMSSIEIATVCEKRHDNVKRTIETLVEQGVIVRPQFEDEQSTDALGRERTTQVYKVGKRDSYIVVAQLSPQFTARLVDRWQFLEEQIASPSVTASDLLSDPRLFAKVLTDYADTKEKLEHTQDQLTDAIRTKAQIGSKREATAMARVSVLSKENEKLKAEIGDSKNYKQVKAISWIVGKYSVWGKRLKKKSDEMGLEVRQIPDSKYGVVNAYHVDVIHALYQNEFQKEAA